MISVCGRMLSPPNLLYKGNTTATSSSGGWNLRNLKFSITLPKTTANSLEHWGCLKLQDSRIKLQDSRAKLPPNAHEVAISEFEKTLRNCGIQTSPPWEETLNFDVRKRHFCDQDGRSIEDWFRISRRGQKTDIMLVVLQKKDTVLYNQIKRLFDQTEGIHTVCVTVIRR